jgi:hypothetical protein
VLRDVFLASIFLAYVEPKLFSLSRGKILQCSPYHWQCPVPFKIALGMLHWAMHSALHRQIVMAIKMAHDEGTFVCCHPLFCLTNLS